MRKFLTFVFLFVLAIGGILFLAKDWLVQTAFASAVHTLTGFETQVQGLHLDFSSATIRIEGLSLSNPPEFRQRIFADVPEIYLQMDFAALLRKEKTHIRELRLDVQELNIEKNGSGLSNVSLLSSVKKQEKESATLPPDFAPPVEKSSMPFQLDRMELTLRRVRYEDHSSLVPKKLSVDLRIRKQVFEGIRDPKSIVNLILMKVITATSFGNLGVDPAELQDRLKSTVMSTREFGEKFLNDTTSEFAEKGGAVGKKVLGGGKDTLGQVSSSATEGITSLFGKLRSKLETADSKSSSQEQSAP